MLLTFDLMKIKNSLSILIKVDYSLVIRMYFRNSKSSNSYQFRTLQLSLKQFTVFTDQGFETYN